MPRATPSNVPDLDAARDLGIDTCGRIVEFWGFTRTMGRTFGLLYFSAAPLSQAQIQTRLRISAGSASMTLAALGRWGVVHRVWLRGQRREHYQAETDFWKMISGVLNERERREIGAAVETLEKARALVAGVQALAKGPRRIDAVFVAERLERLNDICQLGQTLLDMLLGQLKLDVGQFRHVFRASPGPGPGVAEPAGPPSAGAIFPSPGAGGPSGGPDRGATAAPPTPPSAPATAPRPPARRRNRPPGGKSR
jgi:DNA-binding transcriptional regulator GbsR (MarR family)